LPLPQLQNITTVTDWVAVAWCDDLNSLDGLGGLVSSAGLNIQGNPSLLTLTGLASIDGVPASNVWVNDNASLPQCQVTWLMAQLGISSCECTGNTGAGSCN
jgi:hypothetical protein